ncbi:MAG: PDZ domain-containing protein, partial [Clostridia bacterium]|nr:PDZ domain-containing protein [Clostridia bacterium]
MKIARFFIKTFFIIALTLSFAVFGAIAYLEANISKEYKIKKGDTLTIDTKIPVTAVFEGAELSAKNTLSTVGREYEVNLKAFGLIPFSTVNVEVVDEMQVVVLGNPFGMKIYTEGVLVVDMTDVCTGSGSYNPAREAGIKKGDYIISVNGTKVYTNEDLSKIVEKSNGAKMNFLVMREGKKIHINFCAAKDVETGSYKIGIWIKDSSAGIGTLTFYSPATNMVCGLGHGICDDDTGTLLELKSGEIVDAQIISVQKGEVGSPGKLNGKLGYEKIGDTYKPIESESVNPNGYKIRREIKLLLDYLEKYLSIDKDNNYKLDKITLKGNNVEKIFKTLMGRPERFEVDYFGQGLFCDDVLESQMQSVAAKLSKEEIKNQRFLSKLLIMLGLKKGVIHESAWIEGSIVRNGEKISYN